MSSMSLSEILLKLNGRTFTVIALSVVVFFGVWCYGMASKTQSMLDPSRQITRRELEAEIQIFNARALERIAKLDRQDALKQMLLDQAAIIGTGGQINPLGFLNSIISIASIGYAVDSGWKLSNANKKIASLS